MECTEEIVGGKENGLDREFSTYLPLTSQPTTTHVSPCTKRSHIEQMSAPSGNEQNNTYGQTLRMKNEGQTTQGQKIGHNNTRMDVGKFLLENNISGRLNNLSCKVSSILNKQKYPP